MTTAKEFYFLYAEDLFDLGYDPGDVEDMTSTELKLLESLIVVYRKLRELKR